MSKLTDEASGVMAIFMKLVIVRLKVLSSEMDPAEIRFPEIYRKIRPSCEVHLKILVQLLAIRILIANTAMTFITPSG